MPGAGKTRKEYYINVNKEATFGAEPSTANQTALSGEIQDTPTFKPSNEPIRTKKHSELGAISNVLKGAFRGTLSKSLTLQDWRPFYRLFGRTIDQPKKFTVSASGGGDFVADDTIALVSSNKVYGNVASVTGSGTDQVVTLKLFVLDESVNKGGLGAGTGGTIRSIEFDGTDYILTLEGVTVAYDVTAVITGVTSAAERGISAVSALSSGVQTITLVVIAASDDIDDEGTKTATVAAITVWNHKLGAFREQPSYTLNYAYKSLNNQHLMTGCVLKKLGLESAVNEAPKVTEDWLYSDHTIDATRDDEVSNTLALYEYVDISSLSIDSNTQDGTSVDWTDILKAVTAEFNRSILNPIDSHTTQSPTGFKGAEIESTLSFEIHRQDSTLFNLNLTGTDDDFAIILTFARGTSGEDDAVLTYSTCRTYEIEEAGEETILLTVPIEVKGTPTLEVNDTNSDYTS